MADDGQKNQDHAQIFSNNEGQGRAVNEQLIRYLALDEEDLLELLGAELLGTGPGFGPEDFDRQIRFAQQWLERRRRDLREKLCPDVAESITRRDKQLDALVDAATVADALAGILGKPSASIVAVLLLRRGLANLCSGA